MTVIIFSSSVIQRVTPFHGVFMIHNVSLYIKGSVPFSLFTRHQLQISSRSLLCVINGFPIIKCTGFVMNKTKGFCHE